MFHKTEDSLKKIEKTWIEENKLKIKNWRLKKLQKRQGQF